MISARNAAVGLVATVLASAGAAHADTVDWVDWTLVQGQQVFGVISPGPDQVGVTFQGARGATQVLGLGTDYWVETGPTPYTGGVVNRPDGTDYLGLAAGGLKTITFSRTVTDPYLAFFNWAGVHAAFSAPFTVVSTGCATLGCGSVAVSGGGTVFDGVGQATGVLRFEGAFDSLTFTDSTVDVIRGFRVGIAAAAVPEPAVWAQLIAGFGVLGGVLRRRRRAAIAVRS